MAVCIGYKFIVTLYDWEFYRQGKVLIYGQVIGFIGSFISDVICLRSCLKWTGY